MNIDPSLLRHVDLLRNLLACMLGIIDGLSIQVTSHRRPVDQTAWSKAYNFAADSFQ